MASEARPAPPSHVRREAVARAVDSLLTWMRARPKPQRRPDDEEPLLLVLALNNIPHRGRPTAHLLPLPHPPSACLVADHHHPPSKKKKKKQLRPEKGSPDHLKDCCSSTLLRLRAGTCCAIKVGRMSQDRADLIDNFMAAIDSAVRCVPRKWANVRSLHVKSADSLALPIYPAAPEAGPKNAVGPTETEEVEEAIQEDFNEKMHDVVYMDDDGDLDDDFGCVGHTRDGEVDDDDALAALQRMMKKSNKDVKAEILEKERLVDGGVKRNSEVEKPEWEKVKRSRV